MKRILALLTLLPALALAQAVRFDSASYTTAGNTPSGATTPVLAMPGATIAVCQDSVCATRATTYTTATASTPCSTQAQITPAAGGACSSASDAQGNFGFWILPGSYYYTMTFRGTTYGPYPISVGSSSGCPSGFTCDANYSTLALACAAAGSGTLFVSKVWNATPTISLCNSAFGGVGKIVMASSQTLTVAGNFDCPVGQQCIDVTTNSGASVVFTAGKVPYISVNWLGSRCRSVTTSPQDTYINKAFGSAVNVAPVYFPCTTSVKNLVSPASAVEASYTRVYGAPGAYLDCQNNDLSTCIDANYNLSANQVLQWEMPYKGPDASNTTTNGGTGLRIRGNVPKLITPPSFYAEGFRGTGSSAVWAQDVNNGNIQGLAAYCYVCWRFDGLNSGFATTFINVRSYTPILVGMYAMLFGNNVVILNAEGNAEKWNLFCGGCNANSFTVRSEGGNHSGTAGLYTTQIDSGDVPGLYPGFSYPAQYNQFTSGGNAGANEGFNIANNGANACGNNVVQTGQYNGGTGFHVDTGCRRNAFRYVTTTVANSDKTTEICGTPGALPTSQACQIGGAQTAHYYVGSGSAPQLAGGFNDCPPGSCTQPTIAGDSWVSRITVGDGAGSNYGNVVVTNPTSNNPICQANDESTGYRTVTVRPLNLTLVQLHASSNWTNGQTVTLTCGYHTP